LVNNLGRGVVYTLIPSMDEFGDLVWGLVIVPIVVVVVHRVIVIFITGIRVVVRFENVGGRDKGAWVMGGFNLTMHGVCRRVRVMTKRERFVKCGAIRELGDAVDGRKNFGLQ
jgi:hypothetical protein